jgi:uncharacterized protein (TIGR02646 family)
MRLILSDDVEQHLPPDWDELVAEAEAYVRAQAGQARDAAKAEGKTQQEVDDAEIHALHAAIKKRSKIWKAAAEALRKASADKCWYCEMRQERSDMPIDHFRPKNRVYEAPTHPGYWWLAFDWTNFRFSCTYCNSKRLDVVKGTGGGKQDHFPIIEPPARTGDKSDPNDRPMLLDPLVDDDTKLLSFHSNGFPMPTVKDKDADDYKRAIESIRLYHLDHSSIVRKRKNMAMDIRQFVQLAENARMGGDNDGFRKTRRRS